MKVFKGILVIVFTTITLYVSAQNTSTIEGKVYFESDTVFAATVTLYSGNNTPLSRTIASPPSGSFTLDYTYTKGMKYFLVASHIGFASDTLFIDSKGGNINVGTLFLREESEILNEVVISASLTTIRDGIKYVVPNNTHKLNATDALIMLEKINLPRIQIDAITKSLSVNGGGIAKVLINGRAVSTKELSSLSPKEVKRIEYHDIPEAKYGYADIVLDIITNEREAGGSLYMSLWHGLATVFGEDDIVAKVNTQYSQFSLSYYVGYRNWHHLWRENEEEFTLSDRRLERNEVGKPNRFKYDNHSLKFDYNYQKDKTMVHFYAGVNINNRPNRDWESVIKYQDKIVNLKDLSASKYKTPRMGLYVQYMFDDQQFFALNLTGMYTKSNYQREYSEVNLINNQYFNTEANEEQGGIGFSSLYENKLSIGTVSLGLELRHSNTQNKYLQSANGSISSDYLLKMSNTNGYFFSQYGKQLSNSLYLRAGVGISGDWQNNDGRHNSYYTFQPSLTIRYSPSKKFDLRYFGSISNQTPTLANLSHYSQEIDFVQIQRGNQNLTRQINYYNSLIFSLNFKQSALALYLNHTYSSSPIMESSFIEGDKIIRSVENHKGMQSLIPEVEYRGTLFEDLLTYKVYCGLKYYISQGNSYYHEKLIPYYGGRLALNYKKWSLAWTMKHRTSDYFWGETLTRNEDGHMLSLGYFGSKFRVSVDALNLFSPRHISAIENYSAVAPYRRYEYLDEIKNLFRINLTLNLSYGKKSNTGRKKLSDNVSYQSGILTGEK